MARMRRAEMEHQMVRNKKKSLSVQSICTFRHTSWVILLKLSESKEVLLKIRSKLRNPLELMMDDNGCSVSKKLKEMFVPQLTVKLDETMANGIHVDARILY